MASVQIEVEECDAELKHLGFVRTMAINAATSVANLYNSAKQNSGALKSTVEKAENAVTAVVSPVFDRLKGVPGDILVSLDKTDLTLRTTIGVGKLTDGLYYLTMGEPARVNVMAGKETMELWHKRLGHPSRQVDKAASKLDEFAPPAAKSVLSEAQSIVKKASDLVRGLAEEAKVDGLLATISRAARKRPERMKQVEQYPVLHGMCKMAIPTATFWSEKYNQLVRKKE